MIGMIEVNAKYLSKSNPVSLPEWEYQETYAQVLSNNWQNTLRNMELDSYGSMGSLNFPT